MPLQILPIPAFQDNYIWLMYRPGEAGACVVDPGDAEPVIKALEQQQLSLQSILLTHHHPDHTGGVRELVKYSGAKVYGPDSTRFRDIDEVLHHGDQRQILGIDFKVLAVPGHTLDHIAYHGQLGDRSILFCGDTLFSAGCGRLFEGTAPQMLESLDRLSGLPDTTEVFAAHEYTLSNLHFALAVEPDNPALQKRFEEVERLRKSKTPSLPSTIALEKATNPFLRVREASVINAAQQHRGVDSNDPATVFAAIRRWKDTF